MDKVKRFLKTSGIYFIGDVLIKIISFLLLPIYTKYIAPSQYGEYDLYINVLSFFVSVLFLDIWASTMRFMFDGEDEESKKSAISNGYIIFLGSLIVYLIITTISCNILDIQYSNLIITYGVIMCFGNLYSYIARGYSKNIIFTLAGIIGTTVTILVNIILLVGVGWDYSSLYIAGIVGGLVRVIILAYNVRVIDKRFIEYIDIEKVKMIFKYSIPLCFNSVAFWFLTSYSRIVIAQELGTIENGLYAIASKFAIAITLIAGCFSSAWQELAFMQGNKDEDDFYSIAYNLYIKFLGCGVLGLLPIIYLVFPFMVDGQYLDAKFIIPTYLLGSIVNVFSTFLGSIFGAIKKTSIIFYTTVIGSVVNVLLVHLLISDLGLIGVNISLFVGFLINIIIRTYVLKKHISINVNANKIFILSVVFIVEYILFMRSNIWGNIISLGLAIIISFILFREEVYILLSIMYKKIKGGANE